MSWPWATAKREAGRERRAANDGPLSVSTLATKSASTLLEPPQHEGLRSCRICLARFPRSVASCMYWTNRNSWQSNKRNRSNDVGKGKSYKMKSTFLWWSWAILPDVGDLASVSLCHSWALWWEPSKCPAHHSRLSVQISKVSTFEHSIVCGCICAKLPNWSGASRGRRAGKSENLASTTNSSWS